jgi:penicillin-binding protein 1A
MALGLACCSVLGAYLYVAPSLPSVEVLKDVQLQEPMRVYTRDGRLIAEFGEQKRAPAELGRDPSAVIDAFLAAEDDRFFQHPGVDYQGLLRAA